MQPTLIAREALKRLAERKLPPTPANYQACYNEIANLPNRVAFPDEPLRRAVRALTARGAGQQAALDALDLAIGRHSWVGIEQALLDYDNASQALRAEPRDPATNSETGLHDILARFAGLIEGLQPALQLDDERVRAELRGILHVLRDPQSDLAALRTRLAEFSRRLAFIAEEQGEIKHSLINLLHLVIENIRTLVLDDTWLDGQVRGLLEAIRPPLSLRRLDDVERRIREVMQKQAVAKERSLEAQEEMRQMLGAFIEHLNEMNDSSTAFQDKIEASSRRVSEAQSLEELAPILKEVIDASTTMVQITAHSRDQLQSMQDKVLATEAEIAKLHLELDTVSAMARHDPLTNILNRKGLDEALAREIASMRRKGSDLSLALLDIDNFKKINDQHGHDTGDQALVHLANVVRESLRPDDSLARYGGEEFVILMPDTRLDEALVAMARLQRTLTKRFFLAGGEKILITFSAGVAQLALDEAGGEAIRRADAAMYLAKRAGKNRVLAG
ncbi:MAG: diguanylate cyclase [Pseudomonadota bacterium]